LVDDTAVPPDVVTETADCEPTAALTVKVIEVGLLTVNTASVLPCLTEVASVKLAPVIVIVEPNAAELGVPTNGPVNEMIVGAGTGGASVVISIISKFELLPPKLWGQLYL
jgi:hypothetical protein